MRLINWILKHIGILFFAKHDDVYKLPSGKEVNDLPEYKEYLKKKASTDYYQEMTNRNIGLVTHEEQAKLKNSCVAVFGAGGLGGVVSEVLCRSGVGHLKIIEYGEFEPTNLNRQVYCFRSTLGKKKNEVARDFLKDINPDVKVDIYDREDFGNIKDILKSTDVVVLAVDKVKACIVISRAARKLNIPVVESWAVPYGNVRVFTKDTISLEEAYALESLGKDIGQMKEEDFKSLTLAMIKKFLRDIEGLDKFCTPLVLGRMEKGENPTLAPFVWLNAVLMSLEAVKLLLGWGDIALAPKFAVYDPLLRRIPEQATVTKPLFTAAPESRIKKILYRTLNSIQLFIVSSLFTLVARVFYRVKVERLENIPGKGKAILAANHASFLDPMLLYHFSPRKFRAITGEWLFNIPGISWVFRATGCISTNSASKEGLSTLENDGMILIYPEGRCRREKDPVLEPPHKGVAVFALKTGASVIPIGIKGTFEAWPQSKMLPRLFKAIQVKIGRPIKFEKHEEEKIPESDIQDALDKIMASIHELMQ